jgi:hypothetical protein
MTDKQKQWLVWGILVVMIAVAGFLGIEFPVPVPAPPVAVAPQAFIYPTGAIYFAEGGKSMVFQSGSQLTASSGSTVTLDGEVILNSPTITTEAVTTLTVSGPAALNGGLTMDTNKFTVADGTGNTVVSGTLYVTNTTTLVGAASVGSLTTAGDMSSRNVTGTGALALTGAASVGSLTTAGDVSSRIVTATAQVSALSFTPSASGSAAANNYCMSVDCDTGFWYPGDNIIGISAGGVERARVTAAGFDVSWATTLITTTASGPVALNSGLTMDTDALTVADTSGNTVIKGTLNVTGTLSQSGVSFSGPVKYGTASTYAAGTSLVHGFATTPTVCMLWPAEVTATLTITTTGFSSDRSSGSNPVYWLCGK